MDLNAMFRVRHNVAKLEKYERGFELLTGHVELSICNKNVAVAQPLLMRANSSFVKCFTDLECFG